MEMLQVGYQEASRLFRAPGLPTPDMVGHPATMAASYADELKNRDKSWRVQDVPYAHKIEYFG